MRTSLPAVLLVVLSLVDPASASQETGTIFGTLVDRSVPVRYAIISIDKLWIAEQTGADGTFRLANVPPGTYRLRVHRRRAADFGMQVTVTAGREDTIVVRVPRLEPPCPRPTPECTRVDKRQHSRIGMPCEIHSGITLAADTVRVLHGEGERISKEALRDSFPNALTYWLERIPTVGGTLTNYRSPFNNQPRSWAGGREMAHWEPRWMEVAYCRECREAQRRYRDKSAAAAKAVGK